MTITYGFYNSIDHDRVYNAVQMSSIFDGIIKDGVFMSIGTALQVTPGSGLSVVVGVGRAWFNHTWTLNDAPLSIPIDTPDLVFPRIDVIILEINSTDLVRANSIKVIKGTPASSPTVPTLTNTSSVHQYPLAYISIPVGASSFTPSNITNKVGSSLCPFITGVLSTINTDSLVVQWQNQFTEWFNTFKTNYTGQADAFIADAEADFLSWFDEMKDQLSTDAAGNLQLQINSKIAARQGSHPTSWGDGMGTLNNYLPPFQTKIQVGATYIHGSGAGEVDVVFPQAFTDYPMVFLTVNREGLSNIPTSVMLLNVEKEGFKARATLHNLGSPYHSDATLTLVYWMAIGPY